MKSPINYVGNKYQIIDQLIPSFPEKISTYFDVFGGSGTVLINTKAEKYIYNDINPYVSSIFKGLISWNTDDLVQKMEEIIEKYSLSKTNQKGFEKLRDDYNTGRNDWITLYVLMCYSFNNQFRFNNKHLYNSSFGKRCFSDRQKSNLYLMKKNINSDVVVMSKNFMDIDYSCFTENDLLYFDPPYLNSVGNYNDGKRGFEGWTEEHEKYLLELLDNLHKQGIRFALSNNLKYNNPILDQWKDKYKIHYLNGNYANCNHQKKDRSQDVEVLITNY